MGEETEKLLACLRREGEGKKVQHLQAYTALDWEAVLGSALRYGVAPLLYQALKPLQAELSIPEAVWEKLRSIYYSSAARNMRLYSELLKVIEVLNSKGVPVIVLKGAHLAETVYGNIALRPMADVDLLAREEDLVRVHRVLIEEGYSSGDGELSCQLHLAPYSKEKGQVIELHFSITRPPVSERFAIATLWERVHKYSYQGVEVLTLGPEDLMLHICTHTCLDHSFDIGIMPYLDILHTVEHYGDSLSWEQLWERASEWGIERTVYLMLALTEKMLGLAVPEEIKAKMETDREVAGALNTAEEMIFERGAGVSPVVARMFGRLGRREKLKYFLQRTFPPKEKMSVAFREPGRSSRLKLYWLYLLRVQTLLGRHGKLIWSGMRKQPEAVTVLDLENRKNNLRDWLTKNEQGQR